MQVTNKMTWDISEVLPGRVTTPKKGTMTVPDDTMSIKELMTRFAQGKPLDDSQVRDVVYDANASFDSPDLEALARMDDNERDEYLTNLRQDIAQRKAAIKASDDALKMQAERAKERDSQRDPKSKDGSRKQTDVPKAKGSPQEHRKPKDDQREDDGDRGS